MLNNSKTRGYFLRQAFSNCGPWAKSGLQTILIFGPLSTPIYIEIYRTMVIIWPSDICLWAVFGPLCPSLWLMWGLLSYVYYYYCSTNLALWMWNFDYLPTTCQETEQIPSKLSEKMGKCWLTIILRMFPSHESQSKVVLDLISFILEKTLPIN